MAIDKMYKGQVKQLIVDIVEWYKGFNPEGLKVINGEKTANSLG